MGAIYRRRSCSRRAGRAWPLHRRCASLRFFIPITKPSGAGGWYQNRLPVTAMPSTVLIGARTLNPPRLSIAVARTPSGSCRASLHGLTTAHGFSSLRQSGMPLEATASGPRGWEPVGRCLNLMLDRPWPTVAAVADKTSSCCYEMR